VSERINRFGNSPNLIFQDKCTDLVDAGQCDCACVTPSSVSWQSKPLIKDVAYSFNSADNFIVLPLKNGNYVTMGGDSIPVVHNHSAYAIASHFCSMHSLQDIPTSWQRTWGKEVIERIVAQMISLGVLVPVGYEAPQLIEESTVLAAWLHITESCNLRCSYCYLSHGDTHMSFDTAKSAINATFKSASTHGFNRVKLKYAGGEPLLQFPLISEIHSYAKSLAKRHNMGLDGVVLSNGTLLTAEMAEVMQSLKIRLMISLDGWEKFHNCQRHYGDGRGTFDAVIQAIDLALSFNLVPNISITVSGRNATGLPDVVAWVLENDLPFSLNFYRENDRSANSYDLRLEEKSIISGVLEAYQVIEANLPRHSLLSSLVDRANFVMPHHCPCGVGNSYIVFDTQGRVSKCQMQMDKLITDASVADPLVKIRADKNGIQNLRVDEREGCCECQWRYWCAGGCPLQTYRATGRYDAQSPNCNIYRSLYPEVIRLEGLRLLKYAPDVEEFLF